MMKYSSIAGTGSYLPPKVISNHDLERMVDTSHDWIVERTGIVERHIAENESVVMMAKHAALSAIESAQIKPEAIDLILFATSTPERVFPSSACLLQDSLGINHCVAFDISAACSGFLYALQCADLYIKNGLANHVLVVGAEVMSGLLDWTDRNTCVLFGDGAGAMLLKAADEPGILSTHLHAESQYKDLLYVGNDTGDHTIKMQGNKVFKLAIQKLADAVAETLLHNQLKPQDLDWIVPHQANIRIINMIADKLSIEMDKVIVTVDRHGNTSAASVPLAFDVAVREGKIQRDQMVLLESFGAGFTWGSALIRY